MKNGILFIILVSVSVAVLSIYFSVFGVRPIEVKINYPEDSVIDETSSVDTTNSTVIVSEPKNVEVSDVFNYEIVNGSSASYSVNKNFLDSDSILVVGTTNDIKGTGWYNPKTGEFYLNSNVDLSSLKTDSSARDLIVKNLFKEKIANIFLNSEDFGKELIFGKNENLNIYLDLNINGVEKKVLFLSNVDLGEEKIVADGVANIKMSDFGINPPSTLNVFTVEDDVELKYQIFADVVN